MDSPSTLIEREVLSWPGVSAMPHRFGGIEFRVNHHEIGHLHGSGILRATFGKSLGDTGYDDRADFTGDQRVNVADFGILRGTFGEGGVPPVGPGGSPQGTR